MSVNTKSREEILAYLQQVLAELDAAARRAADGVGQAADKALDTLLARGRADLAAGRGTDAVIDLVRSHEDALARWRGNEAGRSYLTVVRRMLGSPEPARAGVPPA